MVIREKDDYQAVLDLVSEASKIAPCYGVLGNHESERIYYGDDKDLPSKFENAGLKILRNATEKIRIGKDTVQLIGVEGTSYGFEEYGGREFMDKAKIDPSALSIVMAHIPILFEPQLSGYDFDLGIAGHTHGGIVVLPFIGGLYSSEEGLFPKFTSGKYILEKQQVLVISAGLGDSKIFPPRINNIPELVVIDIDRY
jgi:predicted MPP superfamily phosphohydrolase